MGAAAEEGATSFMGRRPCCRISSTSCTVLSAWKGRSAMRPSRTGCIDHYCVDDHFPPMPTRAQPAVPCQTRLTNSQHADWLLTRGSKGPPS